MSSENVNDYLEKIDAVTSLHPEYKKEAYTFVIMALHHTLTSIGEKRHITGQELSVGIKEYAREQFGPMAKTVLNYWGIHATYDFGKIVYYLIDVGLMARTADDSIEDFRDVYSFEESFNEPIDYDIL